MDLTSIVKEISNEVLKNLFEGGPGSGHWGHKGGPGLRGGSLPRSAGVNPSKGKIDFEIVKKMAKNLEARAKDSGLTKEKALDHLKTYWKGRSEEEYRAAIQAAKIPSETERMTQSAKRKSKGVPGLTGEPYVALLQYMKSRGKF